MMTLDFFITSLIVVLIPGTGVVYTLSTALAAGKRASSSSSVGAPAAKGAAAPGSAADPFSGLK